MRFLLMAIGAIVIAVAAYWGGYYVNFAASPNDQVGATLTRWMPEPIRAWGCGRLAERFPNAPAPGCDGRIST